MKQKQEQDLLLSMTELIYDAANNPKRWFELIDDMAILMQSSAPNDNEAQNIHQTLRPHFQRALDINDKVEHLEQNKDSLSSILDKLPFPVLLIDKAYKPFFMNQHAQKFLQAESFLNLQHNTLSTATSPTTIKLQQIIKNITSSSDKTLPQSQSLLLSEKKGGTCSLHITSAAQANLKTDTSLAAIFITYSNKHHQTSQSSLTNTLKLTPAETRLIHALLEDSHSLPEAADKLGISSHTARNQMKAIFLKTNTNSQSELIKQILRDPAILMQQPHDTNNTKTSRESTFNIFTLQNGNQIEYTEYGDPNGTPMLYFHSIVHSRQQFHPYSQYAKNHGIRIIAIERPGFGVSTRSKKFSLSLYAKDIKQLTQHLSLSPFYVLGDANGAMSALACAAIIPEHIIKVAIISCTPYSGLNDLKKLMPLNRIMLHLAQAMPKKTYYKICKVVLKGHTYKNFINRMENKLHFTDLNIIKTPEYEQIYSSSVQRALSQDTEAFIEDYSARLYPLGFSVNTIVPEVHLWHGVMDMHTNITSAKTLAEAIPNCKSTFLEGCGHNLFISHIDQVLSQLLGHEQTQRVFP